MKYDLAANAQVAVRDELRLFMGMLLLFKVHVQHAHCNTRKGNHKSEDLPCPACKRQWFVLEENIHLASNNTLRMNVFLVLKTVKTYEREVSLWADGITQSVLYPSSSVQRLRLISLEANKSIDKVSEYSFIAK